eukprot:8635789-Pyramimonas_sp.AAC.1
MDRLRCAGVLEDEARAQTRMRTRAGAPLWWDGPHKTPQQASSSNRSLKPGTEEGWRKSRNDGVESQGLGEKDTRSQSPYQAC